MHLTSRMRATLAITILAAQAACVPPAVSSDRDETIAIPHGATWAWAAPDSGGGWQRDLELGNTITHQRYRRAIETAMEAKGFVRASAGDSADFLLSYHLGNRRAGAVQAGGVAMIGVTGGPGWGRPGFGGFDYGYGWPGWGWGYYGPPVFGGLVYGPGGGVPYRDGALFVVLRQRESGDVAWEGRYALDPSETHKATPRRVQAVVDQLFARLP